MPCNIPPAIPTQETYITAHDLKHILSLQHLSSRCSQLIPQLLTSCTFPPSQIHTQQPNKLFPNMTNVVVCCCDFSLRQRRTEQQQWARAGACSRMGEQWPCPCYGAPGVTSLLLLAAKAACHKSFRLRRRPLINVSFHFNQPCLPACLLGA